MSLLGFRRPRYDDALPAHPRHVLHLADLTRELGSALAAAQAKFGGGS